MKTKPAFPILLFTILFLSFQTYSSSQELVGKIPINPSERHIANISGALNDTITFHLIVNKQKNEGKFISSMYYFSNERLLKFFIISEEDEKPEYTSYHINGLVMTLIKEQKDGWILEDVDYSTKSVTTGRVSLKPGAAYSDQNISFIVGKDSNDQLVMASIRSATEVEQKPLVSKDKSEEAFLNSLSKEYRSEIINTSKFVGLGSAKANKGFYNQGNLVFLKEDDNNGVVHFFQISPDGTLTTHDLNVGHSGMKQMDSFIKDDLLFVFSMERRIAFLEIFDLKTEKLLKKIQYDRESFGPYNNVVIEGKKADASFNVSRFFGSYFPKGIGTSSIPTLYIGVNKSRQGNYIVRVGRAAPTFVRSYSGPMVASPGSSQFGGFGTMPISFVQGENDKGNYFEVFLDTELEHLQNAQVPEFDFADPIIYDRRAEKIMKLYNRSYIALKGVVRMINYDPQRGVYLVYNLNPIEPK